MAGERAPPVLVPIRTMIDVPERRNQGGGVRITRTDLRPDGDVATDRVVVVARTGDGRHEYEATDVLSRAGATFGRMAGCAHDARTVEAPVGAMTDAPPVPAPLAVIVGVAQVLAGTEAPEQRLKHVCEYLRRSLPAAAVRFRSGSRRSDRAAAGAETPAAGLRSVQVPRRGGPAGLLEVVDATRPAAELEPLLETVAALLGAALPSLDAEDVDDDSPAAKLHRLTIDALPVGLYVVDREYRVVLWNRKRETGTQGLRRGDVIGPERVLDVLRRQPPELLEAEFDRIFATGETRVDEQEVHVGNDVRTYRTTRLPMRIDSAEVSHVITIGEDVTETRAIQRTMHQTEKLAAVGQLAAGVMHEINNPLATIGGCVAAVMMRLGDNTPPPVKEYRCDDRKRAGAL